MLSTERFLDTRFEEELQNLLATAQCLRWPLEELQAHMDAKTPKRD